MAVELGAEESNRLEKWFLKRSAARLGSSEVFRQGALSEEGDWNPVLDGDVARAAERDRSTEEAASAVDAQIHHESGALGDVPDIFKHGAESAGVGAATGGAALAGGATTCDMNKCGDNYQVLDPLCATGGLGCVGTTGCRFCRVLGKEKLSLSGLDTPSLPLCNSCVCEHHGFASGCAASAVKRDVEEPAPTPAVSQTPLAEKEPEPVAEKEPEPVAAQPAAAQPVAAQPVEQRAVLQSAQPTVAARFPERTCRHDLCAGKFQMYDPQCVRSGGYGCVGQSGCRFCKTDQNEADRNLGYEPVWEKCAQCVCDKHGLTGCEGGSPDTETAALAASAGTVAEEKPMDGEEGAAVSPWESWRAKESTESTESTEQTEQTQISTSDGANTEVEPLGEAEVEANAEPVDDGVNDDPRRFAAAGMHPMQESGPVQPLPETHRITRDGIEWAQAKFGAKQTCEEVCTALSKTCVEHAWPADLNALRDVVSRARDNDGAGGVVTCNEIRLSDASDHCGGVTTLSGRCFLSPSRGHLPASCTTAPKHADCSNICPCR